MVNDNLLAVVPSAAGGVPACAGRGAGVSDLGGGCCFGRSATDG